MIPHKTPFFLPWLYPSLTWKIECQARELYLTFDDGPVPGPTEFVLEELGRAAVPATFFCIGDNIRKHSGVFRRIIEGGHDIGNHTMNHVNGWKTSTEEYLDNVKRFDSAATEFGGVKNKTDLFRPPYGRITRRQIKALAGYRIIMWDVLSQDYSRHLSSERCLRSTIRACRPGSIVVFHDSYKSEKNMRYTLPRLIDHFAGQGYTFGKLSTVNP
ncbi:MAG TPA: polysaccharide deacetylase family protein [Chryseosolibacter sp.]|nr:polysaccharide deacetylase family protein [Chryseosolibacter sp.]